MLYRITPHPVVVRECHYETREGNLSMFEIHKYVEQ